VIADQLREHQLCIAVCHSLSMEISVSSVETESAQSAHVNAATGAESSQFRAVGECYDRSRQQAGYLSIPVRNRTAPNAVAV
jgi:hypothetical protein